MNKLFRQLLIVFLLLSLGVSAHATPSQYGVSGLLGQPSADTLESGNISVGVWSNTAKNANGEDTTIIPVSLTMGLGSFLETYASFPNLLFNDEEVSSGRGFATLGFKARVLGKRSSPYKLSLDLHARRLLADDEALDGSTDLVARTIVTAKRGRFGLHLNAGYLLADDEPGFDDRYLAGVGIEYFPMARLRMIAELESEGDSGLGTGDRLEALAGVQYFYSPHFTFHLGVATGLTDSSADWRLLAGVSTSQGIGTFTKPVPRIVEPVLPVEKKKAEKKKKVRFKTITPLLPLSDLTKPVPRIQGEVPVNPEEEKIVVEPADRLKLPSSVTQQAIATPISTPAPERIKKGREQFEAVKPIETVVYRRFNFSDDNFDFDQHSLSDIGLQTLADVAASLRREKKWFLIRINGYTDSVGSYDYNEKISLQRASAVGEQLVVREGFDSSRIFVKGYGEELPVASNNTPEGRKANRRVELLVLFLSKVN